jgi:putative tryptophan/tyrosine transport system substrate-binding protein
VTRRDLIALLGSTAAMWPVGARTQQTERVRRIGALMPFAVVSAQYQARISAFLHGLRELGWIDGRNIKIEYRASTGNPEEIRKHATELVRLGPDVILATGVSTVGPLQQATSAVPIVFAVVPDPVGA